VAGSNTPFAAMEIGKKLGQFFMVKSVKSTHNTNSMGSRAKCHQLVYDSQKHPATSDVGGIPTSEIPWLVA